MADFRAELAALVAAYDNHRKWTINAVFERLRQAVEHARAVLAQPEPAPAADGEVAELVEWLRVTGELLSRRSDIQCRIDLRLFARAADLLERQALRPTPPTYLSDRLPQRGEMTDDREVWIEHRGGEYPVGDNDYEWDPHKWILKSISQQEIRNNLRWLPAHYLPLPEEER